MENIQPIQLEIKIDNIILDYSNPRITGQKFANEKELIEFMYYHYSLDELALSMSQFGYFNAEPLVAIPEKLPEKFLSYSAEELSKLDEYKNFINSPDTNFIVVEGNRRASTIKLLLNISDYKNILNIRKEIFNTNLDVDIITDLSVVPVIIYPFRKNITPYLGVRHIGGNKPWDPYPQALYIASLIEKDKYSFDEVKNLMSDKSGKVIKNYLSLKLLDLAEELGLDTDSAKNYFSLLTLSIGQGPIKKYLGLPKELNELESKSKIIEDDKIDNFIRYYKWVFGDKKSGKQPIISESRDITKYLTKVLDNNDSIEYLEKYNDIEIAYEKSDGEKNMVISGLSQSHRKLLNLGDTLDYLLKKGDLQTIDIEREILSLNNDIEKINNIFNKYKI